MTFFLVEKGSVVRAMLHTESTTGSDMRSTVETTTIDYSSQGLPRNCPDALSVQLPGCHFSTSVQMRGCYFLL